MRLTAYIVSSTILASSLITLAATDSARAQSSISPALQAHCFRQAQAVPSPDGGADKRRYFAYRACISQGAAAVPQAAGRQAYAFAIDADTASEANAGTLAWYNHGMVSQ